MPLTTDWRNLADPTITSLPNWGELDFSFGVTLMNIGINKITEANLTKVYTRYVAFNYALGYPDITWEIATFRRIVGYSTNVSEMTDAAFKKHIIGILMSKANERRYESLRKESK